MTRILMNTADIEAATAWAKSLCISSLGQEKGEKHFRTLPALSILRAWSKKDSGLIEA